MESPGPHSLQVQRKEKETRKGKEKNGTFSINDALVMEKKDIYMGKQSNIFHAIYH